MRRRHHPGHPDITLRELDGTICPHILTRSAEGAPLHYAALNNKLEAVEWLLNHGARVDAPSQGLYKCGEHIDHIARGFISPTWYPTAGVFRATFDFGKLRGIMILGHDQGLVDKMSKLSDGVIDDILDDYGRAESDRSVLFLECDHQDPSKFLGGVTFSSALGSTC
ncbi:hypothetical protein B0H66DRAFT_597381 [Apodospora peruviana]|uniref:Ankyrin repeat protein n=1 Tax=Apodospora peruviana TaxID=516989 RepID=A0AAE0IRP7_9PEZI|nr:hypothetical protein B0H66DRAFT_597381 [Apodospora peruviana]